MMYIVTGIWLIFLLASYIGAVSALRLGEILNNLYEK